MTLQSLPLIYGRKLFRSYRRTCSPQLLRKAIIRKQRDRIVHRIRESFAVKTADELNVSFSLTVPPSLYEAGRFPQFFICTAQLFPSRGAIEEVQFTLFVGGRNKKTVPDLDGDALGDVLTAVFMDNVTRELAGGVFRESPHAMRVSGRQSAEDGGVLVSATLHRECPEEALDPGA